MFCEATDLQQKLQKYTVDQEETLKVLETTHKSAIAALFTEGPLPRVRPHTSPRPR